MNKTMNFLIHISTFLRLALLSIILMILNKLNKRLASRVLRRTLIKLGPVYIKIGQALSTRIDLLSEPYINELSKLRNSVPAISFEKIKKNIPDKSKLENIEIDPESIASGSVAQVYVGFKDNQKLAIKILRPNIERKISQNFALIKIVTSMVEFFSPKTRAVNVGGIVKELEELLISQTNLRKEAENYIEFGEEFKNDPSITVPKVYLELCSEFLLVMEYIEGIDPYDYHKLNIDPLKLASKVDYLLDSMVFIKGICHADLHPGNFFWNTNSQLVLIDFGLIHRLSHEDKNHIMTFYFSVVEGYYDFASKYVLDHLVDNESNKKIEDSLYELTYKTIYDKFIASEGKPQFADIFQKILIGLTEYQLRLKANYSKMFLTLITIEGYLYSLSPNFDMMENARKKRLISAEYTQVPEKAEQLMLGNFATYSTAKFDGASTPEQAYEARDNFILDQARIGSGDFVLDVGCGRGSLLKKISKTGARPLGITISRVERDACVERGLECLWTSWEEFDSTYTDYPKADVILAIEMLFHLATFHENKVGLLEKRLQRFFDWSHKRLAPGGRLFIQTLNISKEFFDSKNHDLYSRVTKTLPWLGFCTYEQIKKHSQRHFKIEKALDHTSDLHPTYQFFHSQKQKHDSELRTLISQDLYHYLSLELDIFMELIDKGFIKLHRTLLTPLEASA